MDDKFSYADIENWRLQRFKWTDIAGFLCTTVRTLHRWRAAVNYIDPFEDIENDDLDLLIEDYSAKNPALGEVQIEGYLFGCYGIVIPRQRLRDAIARVDPVNLAARRAAFGQKIVRRVYRVGGPHRLWHMDGMHKLIRYGFIVHGCIDGFSRLVIWMGLSTNNRATTQQRLFRHAVKQYGYPSRMRGDLGGENFLVADEMIEKRGLNRSSFIFGPSKHNVRIERHWRDLRKNVSMLVGVVALARSCWMH